jgi:serpin B
MKRLFPSLMLIVAVALAGCQAGVSTPPVPLATFPPVTVPPVTLLPVTLPPVTPPPAPTSQPLPAPSEPVPTTSAPATAQPDLLISARQRISAPAAPAADLSELAQGNTAFAAELYLALQKQNRGNFVFSPFSISEALAMTYAGAQGKTEQQMGQTLHFTLPQARLHPAFNALDLALESPSTSQAAGQFQLNVANSLWGQKGFPFAPAFIDLLGQNYGAGLRLADFVSAAEPARKTINDWVSQQTKNKINDLIPPGALTSNTRLVLANAIYFYAKWLHPFDATLTRPGDFHLLDGTTASVPMMAMDSVTELRYAQGSGYQTVELPYQGEKAAMLLVVPDAGRFAEVQAALTASTLDALPGSLQPKKVELHLPKFKYDSSASLSDTLSQMGMPDAFTPTVADFSGIDGGRDLFISALLHKAFVAVDEDGTEAAAATAVVVGAAMMPVVDVQLTIDRPFIFIIRDTQTGSLLFVGQVTNPQ